MNNQWSLPKKTKSFDKEEDNILEEVETNYSTLPTHSSHTTRRRNTSIGFSDQMNNMNSISTGPSHVRQNPVGYYQHYHSFPQSNWHRPQEQFFQAGSKNYATHDVQYTSYERNRANLPQSISQPSFHQEHTPYHHSSMPHTAPLHQTDLYRESSRQAFYQDNYHPTHYRDHPYNRQQNVPEIKGTVYQNRSAFPAVNETANQKYPTFPSVNEQPTAYKDGVNEHYITPQKLKDMENLTVSDRKRADEPDLKVETVVASIPTSPIQSIQDISKSRKNKTTSLFRQPMPGPFTQLGPHATDKALSGTLLNKDKRERKNMQSRFRAAKLKERVVKIRKKPKATRSEEEIQILNNFELRRFNKNKRSKQRAEEKKKRISTILNKPESVRTDSEKRFLEVSLRAKLRKNEADRRRRKRIKMMGLSIQSSKSSIDSSFTDSDYQTQAYEDEKSIDSNIASTLGTNQTSSASNQIDFNDFFQGEYLGETNDTKSEKVFRDEIDKDAYNLAGSLETSTNTNLESSSGIDSFNNQERAHSDTFKKQY